MSNKPVLMKGETFKKHGHKLTYPVVVEAKYDGVRTRLALTPEHGVSAESYARKPLYNIDQHFYNLRHWLAESRLNELDGEVLVNDNFNDTYRYVRSHTVPKNLLDADFQFILLDVPAWTHVPYSERRYIIKQMAEDARVIYGLPVIAPWHTLAYNEDEVWAAYQSLRARGLEGAMVKKLNHTYQRKRSQDWLKLKPEETFDGRIVGINRAVSIHGLHLDRAGSIDVELEDGSRASPAGLSFALGEDMFQNPEKYLGRWVEFQCMERDRAGGYRHPFFKRFREDKE